LSDDEISRQRPRDLAEIFSDEDESSDNEIETFDGKKAKRMKYDGDSQEEYLEDDLDDFIVEDEGNERGDELKARKKSGPKPIKSVAFDAISELGFSRNDWADVYEMFGDGSDYAYALKKNSSADMDYEMDEYEEANDGFKPRDSKDIEDVFEPAEVEERMFTSQDEKIRKTDIPERYQTIEPRLREPTSGELDSEAPWVAHQILLSRGQNPSAIQASIPMTQAIRRILEFIRVHKLEVPFIITHRFDIFNGQLSKDEVWQVFDENIRWEHIIARKLALKKWSIAVPELSRYFDLISDEDAMKDISDFLHMRHKKEIEEWKESGEKEIDAAKEENYNTTKKLKRPIKRDIYFLAKEANLHGFALQFGINSREFAQNVDSQVRQYVPEDKQVAPLDLAAQFVTSTFPTAQSVLAATRSMLSQEISTELLVRKSFRQFFKESACITVRPTEKGKPEIDDNHEYYHLKYLKNKPISIFDQVDFILLDKAQNEGMLQYSITVDTENAIRFYERFFVSDGFSHLSLLWNDERKRILRMAFDTMVPLCKKWLNEYLLNKSYNYVIGKCKEKLGSILNSRPWDSEELERVPNIFAISCGSGDPKAASFGALIKGDGTLVDHIKLSSIHGKNLEAKQKDLDKLEEFLKSSREVDVIAVSGWGIPVRLFFEEIRRISDGIVDQSGRSKPVIMVKDDIARLYQNSKRGEAEFPGFPSLLKYVISLGRFVQEPLLEIASLFGREREIKNLSLHPLQEHVPFDRLYKALERVLIEVVNSCGVDINRALLNPIASTTLPYVCGLGPRKAAQILYLIQGKGGILESRSDLVEEFGIGPCVFMNCSSFLKVDDEFLPRRRRGTSEILDGTKIHPEDYRLARKIAADALEIEENPDDPSDPVNRLFEDTDGLANVQQLDLSEWASMLEAEYGEPMGSRLSMIQRELVCPFDDPRDGSISPDIDELFSMLTGETDLKIGSIVVGKVVKSRAPRAYVNLNNGLEGTLTISTPLDDGQTVQCRIINLYKDRFTADLVLGGRDNQRTKRGSHYEYFDVDAELRDIEELREAQAKLSKNSMRRNIQHPLFRNFNWKQCVEFMRMKPPGSCLFRPSSKGRDHLSLTVKIAENIFQNIEVKELDKENEFTLGTKLRIEDQYFSDLDEIDAFYVEKLNKCFSNAFRHHKFRQGTSEELIAYINREINANPKRIPYVLGLSQKYPGKLNLVYRLGINMPEQVEYISVSNKGYRFRGIVYADLNSLIGAFKVSPFGY
jgi:transcription elongation factor SPT6